MNGSAMILPARSSIHRVAATMIKFALGTQCATSRLEAHAELTLLNILVDDLGHPLWAIAALRGLALAFLRGTAIAFAFGI